jgi:hypothetical protein
MRAHNRKIRFSPWRYLDLLNLHGLDTFAEWTGKAAVFVSLCGQVAHVAPPLILDICAVVRLRETHTRNGGVVSSHP